MNICSNCRFLKKVEPKKLDPGEESEFVFFGTPGPSYFCTHKTSINKEYTNHITGKKCYIDMRGHGTHNRQRYANEINLKGECPIYESMHGGAVDWNQELVELPRC